MKFILDRLVLSFKKSGEEIVFSDFNYFFGQMGAGKSSIARLIDYCLGGKLEETPALQNEFVAAKLLLEIEGNKVELERSAKSNLIRSVFTYNDEEYEVIIPARKSGGEVIKDSGIEVISDLVFVLAGKEPPKVRKSKTKEDSDLERLSLRDLLWYCYLDQDAIDSSFFNLDKDANHFKKLKSRDVLRFVLGFHQEEVASLEAKLATIRSRRESCNIAATTLDEALKSANLGTAEELSINKKELEGNLVKIKRKIDNIRKEQNVSRPHASNDIQMKAKALSSEISEVELSISDLKNSINKDVAHKNELLSLKTRFKRALSAKAVLEGVEFVKCPRCNQSITPKLDSHCCLCGQNEPSLAESEVKHDAIEQDTVDRSKELDEIINEQRKVLDSFEKRRADLLAQKSKLDNELTRVLKEYDSAYLSTALEQERERASIEQNLYDIRKIEILVNDLDSLKKQVHKIVGQEAEIKSKLLEARGKAEKDTRNLDKLKKYFLDCLVLAKIPGFIKDDIVEITSPHFLPEVSSKEAKGLTETSFANLGSGGKKTLFKCCFAIALHKLAIEVGALFPSFLIIDSPMKNISERINREQFEGFHYLLYELSQNEMCDTQFILIDKEYSPPPENYSRSFFVRYMMPGDKENSPLIPYYKGH